MATIYLVTKGDYSDYAVLAAFSTVAQAEQFCRLCPVEGSPRIELIPLDEMLDHPAGYRPFYVVMKRDGTVIMAFQVDPNRQTRKQYSTRYYLRQYGGKDVWLSYAYLWARNTEHAIKTSNEHRLRAIAAGHWGETAADETTEEHTQ